MNSLRESLASIPGALANSVANLSYMNTPSLSTPSTLSGDDILTKSQAIPTSLITEQWQLILNSDASISDLENAIGHCKELVLNTNECSDERKWLVRHLVELRFSLKELQDSLEDPIKAGPATKVILGHHFVAQEPRIQNGRQHCDHCTGIIWTVVQSSYICSDCNFIVHHKCIDSVIRICAHVIASERKYPIDEICPEIGLAGQGYKCAECQSPLNFNSSTHVHCFGINTKQEGSWIEPRLCDYSGLYYCSTCHWNDVSIIPARIVHNWDFTQRKVCRASLQEINIIFDKAIINLEESNPKLFIFLQKLSTIKKLRENFNFMRKYLSQCRKATDEKFIDNHIGARRHLIQTPDFYCISDLIQAESGVLVEFLNKIYSTFDKHIRSCDICNGKGYICEICGNDEIIYPFEDGCVPCHKCNSIYHRVCWTRKNMTCLKCIRLEERKFQLEEEVQDNENGN